MAWEIEVLGDCMELGILTYCLFVVIKAKSKGCFGFSYVVSMGTDTAENKINDIGGITIEGAWM